MGKKNVLVIGGAGYIGSHIVLELVDKGFNPIILDDFSSGSKDNLVTNCQLIEGDYCNAEVIKSALEQDISAVFLIAAAKSVPESMLQPKQYTNKNIVGAIQLLHCMLQANINKIVFASSAAVYGDPLYKPIDEKHQTNPSNFYGYTKLAIEQLLKWYDQLLGVKYASLRFFNVVGYDQQLRVKGLERNPLNVLPIIMEAAMKQRPYFTIYGHKYSTPDGTSIRDYIHVSDIAEAAIQSLQFLYDKESSFICNLSADNNCSVQQLVDCTKKMAGIDFPIKFADPRPGDVAILSASNKLAKTMLGWTPKYSSLELIIESTLNAYKSNERK